MSKQHLGGPGSNQHQTKPPLAPRDVAGGAAGGPPPPPTNDPLDDGSPRFDGPTVVARDHSWYGIDEGDAGPVIAALSDIGIAASWTPNDEAYDEDVDPEEWAEGTGTLTANYLLGDPDDQPPLPGTALTNPDVQAFLAGDTDRWDDAAEAAVEALDDRMEQWLTSADLPLPDGSGSTSWER